MREGLITLMVILLGTGGGSVSARAGQGLAVVTGRVIDSSGVAVPDATLEVTGSVTRRVSSDGDGAFLVDGLSDGSYHIRVTKTGYVPAEYGQRHPDGPAASLVVAAGQRLAGVSVRLWRYASVTGRVVDDGGEPIADADVRAIRQVPHAGGPNWQATAGARTDDRGIYRLGELVPGTYVVFAPIIRKSLPAMIPKPDGQIASPPSGYRTLGEVSTIQSSRLPIRSETASSVGIYRTTFCGHAHELAGAARIDLQPGDERVVDCTLDEEPGWTVSGRVIHADNTPPFPIELRLVPADARAMSTWNNFDPGIGHGTPGFGKDFGFDPTLDLADLTVSSSDGRYTFAGVPEGPYRIESLYCPDTPPLVPSMSPSQQLQFIRAFGTASLLGGLEPARARRPPGDTPCYVTREDVTVRDADVNVDVTIRPAARLHGKIVFEGSRAAPDPSTARTIDVVQEPADGRSVGSLRYFVDADWTFTTYGAPPGRYFLDVTGQLRGWSVKSIVAGGRDFTDSPFELGDVDVHDVVVTFTDRPQEVEISGRVTTDGFTVDDGALVVLFPADRRRWIENAPPSRLVHSSQTGAHGEYLISDVRPGEYYVAAVAESDDVNELRGAAYFNALVARSVTVNLSPGSRGQDLRTRPGRAR